MITSHQNRIEQLRESFKKKMAEIDDWPKKVTFHSLDCLHFRHYLCYEFVGIMIR